jgi:hypothetical protein
MEEHKSYKKPEYDKFQQFPADQKEILIYGEDDTVVDKLQMDENDPIFTLTFRQMLSESFAEGKHFFVAKIQTKS